MPDLLTLNAALTACSAGHAGTALQHLAQQRAPAKRHQLGELQGKGMVSLGEEGAALPLLGILKQLQLAQPAVLAVPQHTVPLVAHLALVKALAQLQENAGPTSACH